MCVCIVWTEPDILFAFLYAMNFILRISLNRFYWITFSLNWKLLIFFIPLSYFYRHPIVQFLANAHCHCTQKEKPMNCKFTKKKKRKWTKNQQICICNIWFPKLQFLLQFYLYLTWNLCVFVLFAFFYYVCVADIIRVALFYQTWHIKTYWLSQPLPLHSNDISGHILWWLLKVPEFGQIIILTYYQNNRKLLSLSPHPIQTKSDKILNIISSPKKIGSNKSIQFNS